MPQSEIMIADDEGKGVLVGERGVWSTDLRWVLEESGREGDFWGLKTGDTSVINEDGFVWIVDLAYSYLIARKAWQVFLLTHLNLCGRTLGYHYY